MDDRSSFKARIKFLSRPLLRCFRRLERWADRLTGAAGPLFLAIAWALLLVCIGAYFEVVFPRTFMSGGWLRFIFGAALSIYMIYSFLFHYVMAISTNPGSPRKARNGRILGSSSGSKRSWSRYFVINPAPTPPSGASTPIPPTPATKSPDEMSQRSRRLLERCCRKCPRVDGREPFKPERTHHCRVCGRCQLKYDHHCPWIHNCVGLRNERYFILFMLYLASSATLAAVWSFQPFMQAFNGRIRWGHHTPRVCVVLLFVLSCAMSVALWVMAIWQLALVMQGQTTVEANDNEFYQKVAKSKGKTFVNPYDLGWKQNIQFFFNIAPMGRHPLSILVPLPFPPASNGVSWPKRPGWEQGVLEFEDELTDEDEVDD